jgi:hypothetical protein
MDSAEVVRMLKASDIDRSCFTHEVHEIRRLLQLDPRYQLVVIDRNQNRASHMLANRDRSIAETVTWIRSGPEDVVDCCLQEAVPVT